MKKHIVARLYDEAMDKCSSGMPWEFEMHFAELLVQECMQVAKTHQNSGGNCYVDDMIAKHFGVEL